MRRLALLLALVLAPQAAVARALAFPETALRVDREISGSRAEASARQVAEGRLEKAYFYGESASAIVDDPINHRDPTGAYTIVGLRFNSTGQIVAALAEFEVGGRGWVDFDSPIDPESLGAGFLFGAEDMISGRRCLGGCNSASRNTVNGLRAQNALYRAELAASRRADVDQVRSERGDEAAAGLEYVMSGSMADRPQQIIDMADGAVSLGEGDIDRARSVGGPAVLTWVVEAAFASVALNAMALQPLNVNRIALDPRVLWGRSAEEIAVAFQRAGFKASVRQSLIGSQRARIVVIQGHPEITQIQVHPGGGRHGGAYVKVSTSTRGTLKVVGPGYRPAPNEKANIMRP